MGPGKAGSACKSNLLQGEVLVPVRLLHKRPGKRGECAPVGNPADVQGPPEDLAHQNPWGFMGQGDPQDCGDALPDGLQNVSGGHGHTSRPKQGGEDQGSDYLPADLKREGRIGGVAQAHLQFMQAEFERHRLAGVQANVNTKKLQGRTERVAASCCLGMPGGGRLVRDQVALAVTAGESGRGVESRCESVRPERQPLIA